MPCGDNGESEYYDQRDRLNKATRVACELAKFLRDGDEITWDTMKWIMEHKVLDKERDSAV